MKTLNESELIARLKKLEKSQTRYRLAFLLATALAVILCTVGATRQTQDVIQSKSFEIVNNDSKVLARFSSANGKGDFRTYRADGGPLVNVMSSTDDSGRIEVYNANGKPAITLSTSSTGAGTIVVNNSSGDRTVQIGSTSAQHGGVWIYNADGKMIGVVSSSGGTANGAAETYDASGTRTGHLP